MSLGEQFQMSQRTTMTPTAVSSSSFTLLALLYPEAEGTVILHNLQNHLLSDTLAHSRRPDFKVNIYHHSQTMSVQQRQQLLASVAGSLVPSVLNCIVSFHPGNCWKQRALSRKPVSGRQRNWDTNAGSQVREWCE